MSQDLREILKEYWGFDQFRPMQEDIIRSVLDGQDTLALLPTGGGKSLCFQVPIMARPGVGIVISTLIALMNDQVRHLKNIGIRAVALTSGLSIRELDRALDNAVNQYYKVIYLSPERLQSELVQERIKRMKVNLLVVDEAHCISQWGHDFRPSYTQIAPVRELMPGVPVMALTATATPRVCEDIMQQLAFDKPHILRKSFFRENLSYNVVNTENKYGKLIQILQRLGGSGILYLRHRKHTAEVARWLGQNGFSASYYHAGLRAAERQKRQDAWVNNQIRLMVCTNAFGMGIDKPDVRLVIHLDLPDSLEAYFQEAGRAGRDGQRAYAVLIAGPADVGEMRSRYLDNFPDLTFIRRVYQALGNHLQLALGAGEGQSFPFGLGEFCQRYELPVLKTYQALQIMERQGILGLSEGFRQASRILITCSRQTLYDFQLRNPRLDSFIKLLVRSYGGLDVEYTRIDEEVLAARMQTSAGQVHKMLLALKKANIIDYIPNSGKGQISFYQPRQKQEYLSISDEHLKDRYRDRKERIAAVQDFVQNPRECRNIQLLRYFAEKNARPCGICDVCRREKDTGLDAATFEKLAQRIIDFIREHPARPQRDIIESAGLKEETGTKVIRWLLEEGRLQQREGFLESLS